jgi:glycosyltransferase involved in cell wall biosynthesis
LKEISISTSSSSGKSPLVSIVIPTHNYADYVGGAIRSGLEQGYAPVEIIAVDDGSTDGTSAVLRSFGSAIHTLRLERHGVSAARNAGLAASRGTYVVFLDADDLLLPGGVSAQVAHLERRPDVDAVAGDWYVCDVETRSARRERTTLGTDDALARLLRGNAFSTPSAVMLRRSALEAVGGFDRRFAFTADWELWLRLARHGRRFCAVPAAVAMYRVHGRSMTRDIAHAIPDTIAFLDHCFADSGLSATTRAMEPRTRYNIMMYLARLGLIQSDDRWARECVQRALGWNPAALDSFAFYDALVYALSQERRPTRDDHAERILALAHGGEPTAPEPAPRKAMRHLAAGAVARHRRDWKGALRSLGAALRASPRTALQWPQRRLALLLPVPPGMLHALRRALAVVGMYPRSDPDARAILHAVLAAESKRDS